MGDLGKTEQVETGSKETPQTLDIEAPPTLRAGQNFFDQPPYYNVIESISAATSLEKDKLRKLLYSSSTIGSQSSNSNSTMTSQDLSKLLQIPPGYNETVRRVIKNHMEKGSRNKIIGAVAEIGRQLEKYPFWHEYIITQLTHYDYRHDGSPVSTREKPESNFPETYAKWASEKSQKEARLMLTGIKDIFPQDFATETPSKGPNMPRGERPSTTRLRILTASELARRRSERG